ncbi:unnamed protein product [Polarella glacialis]|uniref:Glycoside hydrolase family 5 domain-containing protein n=1 Tax=Polarella glacialis TaxID=89957 RepID=A0A813FC90_POLGL|nr:unnamed protein product [Polarella glacialis]CAE8687543.1 unnamed protein product [Polarella glacialis]
MTFVVGVVDVVVGGGSSHPSGMTRRILQAAAGRMGSTCHKPFAMALILAATQVSLVSAGLQQLNSNVTLHRGASAGVHSFRGGDASHQSSHASYEAGETTDPLWLASTPKRALSADNHNNNNKNNNNNNNNNNNDAKDVLGSRRDTLQSSGRATAAESTQLKANDDNNNNNNNNNNLSASWLVPLSALPLRTRGRDIISLVTGQPVTLACVNWYGAHLKQLVNNGLNVRPLSEIAATISKLRFNCVRLSFSLDMVSAARVPDAAAVLAGNPKLQNLSALEVFDATVRGLTDAGLLVILNNHVSSVGWCCDTKDGEGLWYTEKYPERAWMQAIEEMAGRYRGDARVVGFDLRNELRVSPLGAPTWGGGEAATDWALAASAAGKRVLRSNPEMLIIISGLDFSMFLCDVPQHPLHLAVPELRGHVVYTTHEYWWYNSDLGTQRIIGRPLCIALLAVLGGSLSTLVSFLSLLVLFRGRLQARPLLSRRIQFVLSCLGFCSSPGCCRRCFRYCRCCDQLVCKMLAAVVPTVIFLLALVLGRYYTHSCRNTHFPGLIQAVIFLGPSWLLSVIFWLQLLVGEGVKVSETILQGPYSKCPGFPGLQQGRDVVIFDSPRAGKLGRFSPKSPPVPPVTASSDGGGIDLKPGVPVAEVGIEMQDLAGNSSPDAASSSEAPTGTRRRRNTLFAFLAPTMAVVTMGVGALASTALAWQQLASFEAFAEELDLRWGFLTLGGQDGDSSSDGGDRLAADLAPVWLGEFGTNTDDLWWRHMIRYLHERPVAGWAYWPLNGEKRPGEDETYGLLLPDMQTVRNAWQIQALQQLGESKETPHATRVIDSTG